MTTYNTEVAVRTSGFKVYSIMSLLLLVFAGDLLMIKILKQQFYLTPTPMPVIMNKTTKNKSVNVKRNKTLLIISDEQIFVCVKNYT